MRPEGMRAETGASEFDQFEKEALPAALSQKYGGGVPLPADEAAYKKKYGVDLALALRFMTKDGKANLPAAEEDRQKLLDDILKATVRNNNETAKEKRREDEVLRNQAERAASMAAEQSNYGKRGSEDDVTEKLLTTKRQEQARYERDKAELKRISEQITLADHKPGEKLPLNEAIDRMKAQELDRALELLNERDLTSEQKEAMFEDIMTGNFKDRW